MISARRAAIQSCLLAAFVLLIALAAHSQDSALPAATAASVSTPAIGFEFNWAQADPNWVSITIAADGSAIYRSQEKQAAHDNADAPYTVRFTATENTRQRIFELAKTLDYFHGNYEFRGGNVAKTGVKTLRYINGAQSSETSLNFSTNTDMMDLVDLFQKISATIELGRRIEFKLRFDKLGLDSDLKFMESLSTREGLLEVQTVEPVLRRALSDRGTMNISRQRIQHILSQSSAK